MHTYLPLPHGYPDRSSPESQLALRPELTAEQEFFKQVFNETIATPSPTKALTGPFTADIQRILVRAEERLIILDPSLTARLLTYEPYMDEPTRQHYKSLDSATADAVQEISSDKDIALDALADEKLAPALAEQPLWHNLFEKPPFVGQERSRDCTTAAFCMLFNAITGSNVKPNTVSLGALESDREVLVTKLRHGAQEEQIVIEPAALLNSFQAPLFKNRFNIQVTNIPLIGADFDGLKDLVGRIHTAKPSSRVYCLLQLSSANSYRGVGILHNGILLGSDPQNVMVLDPKYKLSDSHKQVMKMDRFANRWARAHMRGNIIVANPMNRRAEERPQQADPRHSLATLGAKALQYYL